MATITFEIEIYMLWARGVSLISGCRPESAAELGMVSNRIHQEKSRISFLHTKVFENLLIVSIYNHAAPCGSQNSWIRLWYLDCRNHIPLYLETLCSFLCSSSTRTTAAITTKMSGFYIGSWQSCDNVCLLVGFPVVIHGGPIRSC